MEKRTYTGERVTVVVDTPFDEVTRRVEAQAGRADLQKLSELLARGAPAAGVRAALEKMARPSGLMIFTEFDHGRLLALAGQEVRARLYVLGNPLIALEMTRHDRTVGLYAPWRLFVYEGDDGKVRLTCDRPTAVLGQFGHERIGAVARELERKLEGLVEAAGR